MNNLDEAWNSWKITYGRNYNSPYEESFRRAIWERNMAFIEAHNQQYEQGITTFTLGMNRFGDMTREEMPGYPRRIQLN